MFDSHTDQPAVKGPINRRDMGLTCSLVFGLDAYMLAVGLVRLNGGQLIIARTRRLLINKVVLIVCEVGQSVWLEVINVRVQRKHRFIVQIIGQHLTRKVADNLLCQYIKD